MEGHGEQKRNALSRKSVAGRKRAFYERADFRPRSTIRTRSFLTPHAFVFGRYSTPHMVPTALLGPVDQEYMRQSVEGCPNAHFPSDHLALSVEFTFLKR